jgi:putative peptide zinc metalloprotease protein
MRRTLAVLNTAVVLACGAPSPAAASAAGPDQVVQAITTADHPVEERSSARLVAFGGDTLQGTNLARADAHDCTGCRSVAVSVQAILAIGHPTTVAPRNFAVATNENCTGCLSFAFAYQYVVTTAGPVTITDDARRQIADLRKQFAQAAGSGLPPVDLDVRLQQLSAQFKSVIDENLSRAGSSGQGVQHEDEDDMGD